MCEKEKEFCEVKIIFPNKTTAKILLEYSNKELFKQEIFYACFDSLNIENASIHEGDFTKFIEETL